MPVLREQRPARGSELGAFVVKISDRDGLRLQGVC